MGTIVEISTMIKEEAVMVNSKEAMSAVMIEAASPDRTTTPTINSNQEVEVEEEEEEAVITTIEDKKAVSMAGTMIDLMAKVKVAMAEEETIVGRSMAEEISMETKAAATIMVAVVVVRTGMTSKVAIAMEVKGEGMTEEMIMVEVGMTTEEMTTAVVAMIMMAEMTADKTITATLVAMVDVKTILALTAIREFLSTLVGHIFERHNG